MNLNKVYIYINYMTQYTKQQLEQLYRDGLISYTILRDKDIRDKIDSLPGKLSIRVKHVAYSMKLSLSTIYRAIKQ